MDKNMHPIFQQALAPFMNERWVKNLPEPEPETEEDKLQRIVDECNVILRELSTEQLEIVLAKVRETLQKIKQKK